MKLLVLILRFLECIAFGVTVFFMYKFGTTTETFEFPKVLFGIHCIILLAAPLVMALYVSWSGHTGQRGFYMLWVTIAFWVFYVLSLLGPGKLSLHREGLYFFAVFTTAIKIVTLFLDSIQAPFSFRPKLLSTE